MNPIDPNRIDPSDLADYLSHGRRFPAEWCRSHLGVDLWYAQAKILDALGEDAKDRNGKSHRIVAVKSCHAIGKDFLASCAVLWWILTHPYSRVITTAPTARQVKTILWSEIRSRCAMMPVDFGVPKPKTLSWEIDAGWFAIGFTTKDTEPDKFQGQHAPGGVLVIADEASAVSKQIFDEGIRALLTSDNCRCLAIGNPTDSTSEFARLFKSQDTRKFSIPAFKTPNFIENGITPEDIETGAWREKKPKSGWARPYLVTPDWVAEVSDPAVWGTESSVYKSRVLAQFSDTAKDQLIPYAWIEAALNTDLEFLESDPVILSCDVARQGGDETILYRKKGPVVRLCESGQSWATNFTAGRCLHHAVSLNAKAVNIDADGLGAGVSDQLYQSSRSYGFIVGEIHSGVAALDPTRFVNRRSEILWALRERFESREIDIDPSDHILIGQLSSYRFTYDTKNRIAVETKKEMKKRGLKSPDRADAVAYAFVDPKSAKPSVLVGGRLI